MAPNVIAIIQARMASSRLRGKVLADIAGVPMLARVVARASRARRVQQVLVATTTDPSDDPVVAYCGEHGIACSRGSQFDVLDRYYQAADRASADAIVRVTADCPVIEPVLIDDAVGTLLGEAPHLGIHALEPGLDFVANRLPPPFHRTFPIGLDVEVCTASALVRAWREGSEPQHREHVMPFLYEGVQLSQVIPELSVGVSARGFRVGILNHIPDYGFCRWTVDTREDLEFMRQVYARFPGRDDFTWTELLELVRREPELAALNSAVRHKTLRDVDERAAKG